MRNIPAAIVRIQSIIKQPISTKTWLF
jgi:hypothetical protein